jgi:hypothetical protein
MGRKEFRETIEARLEAASARLAAEGLAELNSEPSPLRTSNEHK